MERWMQAVYVIFITLALASHLAQAFTFPGKATIQRMQSASVVSKGLSMVIKDPVGGKVQDICVKPTAHDLATGRDPTRVKVFDTTLRDGEQSPGCTMTEEEKIAVAKQLARLGVDVIEAGFPFASPGDFKAVKRIAESVGRLENPPIICGLARALKADIEACAEAVKPAKFPRIHTFIATSDIHMEAKLKKTREQVVAITREMVGLARSLVEDVEFSAEDALRSDPDFLCEVYSVAIEAGATTINVPDTVGYTTPDEFYALMHKLRAGVRGIDQVTISVHGHDDLGMAVANFLAAIEGGARQVECTINGIGEGWQRALRSGAFSPCLPVLPPPRPPPHRATDDERALTNVNTREIYKTSRLVSSMTGMMVQPNKAIVGANAFAHESGIHQDGVLKNKRTYEIMDAETVGLDDNLLVLGKHSGRAAFRARLTELGYEMAEEELMRAFSRFKVLADVKKEITNMDLEAIVNDEIRADVNDRFKLDTIQVLCGDANIPTATARILDTQTGSEIVTNSIGTGPVDAAFKCILEAVKVQDVKLQEYAVSSVTAGIDTAGRVTVACWT
ncbi:unnamed protein product [Heterosigma akashiwo]